MKSIVFILTSAFLILSCKEDEKSKDAEVKMDQTMVNESESMTVKDKVKDIEATEPRIEIKNNIYSEFYPGTNRLKFQGEQTKDGKRNGKWMFFGEDGTELSMTNYNNGIKNGPTMVKYPNGNIHYTGEYKNDQPAGIWTTYSEVGEKLTVKNFDELK